MRFVTINQLSALGKWAIGVILTFGALLQVPQFSSVVFKIANLHPHIAVIIGALTTLAALLSNPQVDKILGIQPGEKLTAQNPEMDASGTITGTSTTLAKGTESKV